MASCLNENQKCACVFSHDHLGPWEHCMPSVDSTQRLLLIDFYCSFLTLFPFSLVRAQCSLKKLAKLKEMVGEGKEEEEPEGVAVARPSGEAVVHNSGNALLYFTMPPFFLSTNH